MNRKNLTAAVLAGLAGAAGLAGTAQAVNLNPDGLGQLLIYPYYTSNDGNATILSVVNTTDSAKAVKVRFLEGFNSREVLDFNMYMSAYDVWVAAIADNDGTPTLYIPDSTCTVPYLYENDSDDDGVGEQEFLPFDYTGNKADGGPTSIQRAAEGYFTMTEMGTLTNDDEDSADAATHVVADDGVQAPADCQQLVDAWTKNPDGYWIDDETIDMDRNSGGLFGGAAVINVANGTMFSYDARAIQGYDKKPNGNHFQPGNSHPTLDDGDQNDAVIFFGVPNDTASTLSYVRSVDAVSAVFMHEFTMNEYNIQPGLNAASEWVLTFPTKHWYVDEDTILDGGSAGTYWIPDTDDEGCRGWDEGEDFPELPLDIDGDPIDNPPDINGWQQCTYVELSLDAAPLPPFTEAFDGESCDPFSIDIWDREENASDSDTPSQPPIVSPPPPGGTPPGVDSVICYEVNVLRFGNDGDFPVIFGTPTIEGSSILKTVDTGSVEFDGSSDSKPRVSGWAKIDWFTTGEEVLETDPNAPQRDYNGLVGLPVTGFWAEQFENGFLGTPEASVLSNYGGLFDHKANVRRISPAFVRQPD